MSFLLSVVMAICLALDAVWAALPVKEYPLTKNEIVTWTEKFDKWYAEEGLGYSRDISIIFGSPKKAPPDFIGVTGYFHTHGCEPRIMINPRLRYKHHIFYNTPEYIATLAHEVFHVHQEGLCMNNDTVVEPAAEVASFYIMAKHAVHNQTLREAFIYSMRRVFILVTADMLIQQGKDPEAFIKLLNLTEKEENYFLKYDYVGKYLRIQTYWKPLVNALLGDLDGIYSSSAIPGEGQIDLKVIREFMRYELGIKQIKVDVRPWRCSNCCQPGRTPPPCRR